MPDINPDFSNKLIAHAGGVIDEVKYSNSLEAFQNSAQFAGLIELDISSTYDDIVVAHDGTENCYNFTLNFSEYFTDQFMSRKFNGKYTPMSCDSMFNELVDRDVRIVLDIKTKVEKEYEDTVVRILRKAEKAGVSEKVILQVYDKSGLDFVTSFGHPNTIVALWKFFPDVWARASRNLIRYSFMSETDGFRALSIAAKHFVTGEKFTGEKLQNFLFDHTDRVFVHGQSPSMEKEFLSRGFGIFTHNPASHVEKT